ncbi:hypothetical protein [Streptomyces sp. BH104]|uniref:hypothetical protein n=1 Tax=Streptomyces sp. BH104 TaxID=3410407 RepID=UPI003BB56247
MNADRIPQPLTDEQLAEIQARTESATPGPWWTDILPEHGGESIGIDAPGDNWIVPVQDLHEPDAEFVAHARTDVPTLLAEVQRLKGELAKVAEFAAKRAEYITAINGCHNDADYWRWQGQAEARRQLAEELGLPVAWPAKAEEASS